MYMPVSALECTCAAPPSTIAARTVNKACKQFCPCSYIPKTACRTRPSKDEHTKLSTHDYSDLEVIDTEYCLTEYTNYDLQI